MKSKEKLWKITHIGHEGFGSIFGLTSQGREQNQYQLWLRDKWNLTKKIIGKPNVLILGGEIIEGNNPATFAEDIWLPRKLDQLDMSFNVANEYIDTKVTDEVLILYGHIYHGSKEVRVEDILAQRLRDNGINAKSGNLFEREYFGKIFRFWHGSSGAFVYKASSKERQIKFNLEKAALGKTPRFDQQYTYHTHQHYGALLSPIRAISCPAWKLMDTYAELKHPDSWIPDIGMIVTTIQERFGEVRVNDDEIIYNVPFRFDELEQSKKENKPKARLGWEEFRVAHRLKNKQDKLIERGYKLRR